MHENELITENSVIDDALGENSRSSELRLMRAALEERRTAHQRDIERATSSAEQAKIAAKIKTLDKQIDALRQEEGISEFVETSVRVTLSTAEIEEEG